MLTRVEKMGEKSDSKVVGVRLPIPLYEKLKHRVEVDDHLSQGEYIRTLLRNNLKKEEEAT